MTRIHVSESIIQFVYLDIETRNLNFDPRSSNLERVILFEGITQSKLKFQVCVNSLPNTILVLKKHFDEYQF